MNGTLAEPASPILIHHRRISYAAHAICWFSRTFRRGDKLADDENVLVDPAGLNGLTERINGCAFRVHSELGPGLLEKAYKLAFAKELLLAGLGYKLDVPLTTTYRGDNLGASYFMDAVVENAVIVEIKAVTFNHPVYRAQLVTYLRLTGLPVGLLLNFHARRMKDGISRVLNDRPRPEKEPY